MQLSFNLVHTALYALKTPRISLLPYCPPQKKFLIYMFLTQGICRLQPFPLKALSKTINEYYFVLKDQNRADYPILRHNSKWC